MFRDVFYELYDADDYDNFIKACLKQFRSSNEYKMWLSTFNRNECAATGLTKDGDGIEIEMHHYNITLWGWVEHIINKFQNENPPLPLNTFYICLILNDLHFNRCVPCVPLTHCIHKMIHRSYNDTIRTYPQILNHVNEGNLTLADEIIDHHIAIIKQQLSIEEETH